MAEVRVQYVTVTRCIYLLLFYAQHGQHVEKTRHEAYR